MWASQVLAKTELEAICPVILFFLFFCLFEMPWMSSEDGYGRGGKTAVDLQAGQWVDLYADGKSNGSFCRIT